MAERFDADVLGIEPADRMRDVAEHENPHPRVTYAAGAAESVPLGDGAADLVFVSQVLHHVQDLAAAAREVTRVLRAGGRLFVRQSFSGLLQGIPFYDFFPAALRIDTQRLPPLPAAERAFAQAGLVKLAFETVWQTIDFSLADHLERLRTRAISTFELMSEEDIQQGFAAMEAAVAAETAPKAVREHIDVLTFEKPADPPGHAHD